MSPRVIADLSEDGNNITVHFDYDDEVLQKVKKVPGSRFVGRPKGGPFWIVPLDLDLARQLSVALGKDLKLTPKLRDWGKTATQEFRKLAMLAAADDADLQVLPDVLPDLAATLRPYQRADVAYVANNPHNTLVANQPGLGKTLETIGAIFERQKDDGPNLIVAPITSLDSVWRYELERWQPHPVLVAQGGKRERESTVEAAQILAEEGTPFWLVINPAMVQMVRTGKVDKKDNEILTSRFPIINEITWNNIVLDEIHKAGFRDLKSLTAKGMLALKSHYRIALSGTPIGGKPINLWMVLHYLNEDYFKSKWRWAEQWLEVTDGDFGKEIGNIRKGLEDEFYKAHAPYMVRRTKAEVAPDLPPKIVNDIWVDMSPRQAKQYKQFALEAEVKISEDETISATSVLAEYTRLKQFADAYCTVERSATTDKQKVVPTSDSCKLDALEELLDERGIFGEGGEEQVIIFSQFSLVVDMVHEWLTKDKGVAALKLTGSTNKKGERTELQRAFQAKEHPVICMTTTAGGVAITLDAADTVIFMDETWVPDDQEQAEDRAHRISRMHQVMIYYIRSRETIEDYIARRVQGKQNINNMILDLRRQGLKATGGK